MLVKVINMSATYPQKVTEPFILLSTTTVITTIITTTTTTIIIIIIIIICNIPTDEHLSDAFPIQDGVKQGDAKTIYRKLGKHHMCSVQQHDTIQRIFDNLNQLELLQNPTLGILVVEGGNIFGQ
jgi:hypothetical protein